MTLGELCAWWLRERCPAPSVDGERRRLDLHVLRTPLGDLPLAQVTPTPLDGACARWSGTAPRRPP